MIVSDQVPSSQSDALLHELYEQNYVFNQDLLKTCLQALAQTLMDIEVSRLLDASPYERNASRRAYRNGYRDSLWQTSLGELKLRIPKLRRGTYYPDDLLNNPDIELLLLNLIKQSLLLGINEAHMQAVLRDVTDNQFTRYELGLLIDALHDAIYSHQAKSDEANLEIDVIHAEHPTYQRRRYFVLVSRKDQDNKREIIASDDSASLDKSFWEDFARRMQQSGIRIQTEQLSLLQVNPYAMLDSEPVHQHIHSEFARYINSHYDQVLASLIECV